VQVYLDGVSWDVTNLGMNVGHLQGTAWLEDAGNIALSGHVELADGRAGVFASLHELKPGDLVVLRQGGSERRYSVTEVKTVQPEDLTPLYPTIEERLTLITCGNYNFFQDTYLERVVVVAQRIL
jgi:sortase A